MMREEILRLLEKNSRIDLHDVAVMLGTNEALVANEIAEMDNIMSSPDEHPDVNLNNDWYNLYGEKKNKLQALMEQWEEKAMSL